MARLIRLLMTFLYVNQEVQCTLSVRKFVYQKDMSEHCRRRVMPSVFLGRHVVEANSQILHFSQLEVPYSCYISIRTESGSNIILVIQLALNDFTSFSCKDEDNQVQVFEMGETFGGYWGSLPEQMLWKEPLIAPKEYTLPTETTSAATEATSPIEDSDGEDEAGPLVILKNSSPAALVDEDNYVRVEIPLVNVSGILVESDSKPQKTFGADEMFDFIYDVTPRPGIEYDTKILPLVQVSTRPQDDGRRADSEEGVQEPRFQLHFNLGDFTPDPRLAYPSFVSKPGVTKRTNKKYNYNLNRRLNFKKHKSQLFAPRGSLSYTRKSLNDQFLDVLTQRTDQTIDVKKPSKTQVADIEINGFWPNIEDLFQTLNSKSVEVQNDEGSEKELSNMSSMLEEIANMKHNISAYLTPKMSSREHLSDTNTLTSSYNSGNFSQRPTSITWKKSGSPVETSNLTMSTLSDTTTTMLSNLKSSLTYSAADFNRSYSENNNLTHSSIEETDVNLTTTNVPPKHKTDSTTPTANTTVDIFSVKYLNMTEIPQTGAMVDHESWENVVQAAPVMAVLLNQSSKPILKSNQTDKKHKTNETRHERLVKRKKRHIQAVAIENARPHSISTRDDNVTTPAPAYSFVDMQDFAQLVELQDDEIHGRIALRYLRRYVGNNLFNICEYQETRARRVILLNSSRIVIAINNFTMKRMTVVVTPAHTLMSYDARCQSDSLECQVSGARVCIDSMTACDGVPNCGAYDIYDEDRQRCGPAHGFHRVYLAAFTFLAVLLTLFYSVYYWLKRCVPKVSEAFFIFTDGAENILYLDSIMRSPGDTYEGPKPVPNRNLFTDNIRIAIDGKPKSKCLKKLENIFKFCFCCKNHKKDIIEGLEMVDSGPNNELNLKYSFTELEIQKIMQPDTYRVEMSVQTGQSLEIDFYNEIKTKMTKNEDLIRQDLNKAQRDRKNSADPQKYHANFDRVKKEELPQQSSFDSELYMLKFLRDARSASTSAQRDIVDATTETIDVPLVLKQYAPTVEEMELHSTLYDHPKYKKASSSKPDHGSVDISTGTCSEMPSTSGSATKRLRFDEKLTNIPLSGDIGDDRKMRHGVQLGSGKPLSRGLDDIEEEQQHTIGRDFKRFWSSAKGKKSKKKPQSTLR